MTALLDSSADCLPNISLLATEAAAPGCSLTGCVTILTPAAADLDTDALALAILSAGVCSSLE
jgi:hypothetical protein